MMGRRLAHVLALCGLLCCAHANAQTVADIAARGACSTAGVEGLSAQLAEAQSCLRPGAFVPFAPYPNITLTSSRVHAFVQASARDAIQAAADLTPLSVTSAYRTVADQYVLYNSGGCALAARPGRSNHQSGRAVDLSNASGARAALEAQACVWFGSRDPVHFDCPGMDLRADAIFAFQRVWNVNNPGDPIAEDGAYGPQTDARLASSPATGFADTGCGCMPGCDGDSVILADCSRVACGTGDTCRAGACVFEGCAGGRASVCVDATTFGSCVMGDLGMTTSCADRCVEDADGARCTGAPGVDAGVTDDGGVNDAGVTDDAGRRSGGVISGGCGCRVGHVRGGMDPLLLALLGLACARRLGRRRPHPLHSRSKRR